MPNSENQTISALIANCTLSCVRLYVPLNNLYSKSLGISEVRLDVVVMAGSVVRDKQLMMLMNVRRRTRMLEAICLLANKGLPE